MASVTVGRVAEVHAHISQAVIQTSERSTLPEQEQVSLLAQSCAEACDLLKDWLASPSWQERRPTAGRPIGDYIPDQEDFAMFLDPMFKDALATAVRYGIEVSASYVEEARKAVAATARRNRKMTPGQLFEIANRRVGDLQKEVCQLADQLRSRTSNAARRRKARTVLKTVSGLLITVVLAMGGAGPQQAAQNLTAWTHDIANVVIVHQVAHSAHPSVRITSPHAGPQLH